MTTESFTSSTINNKLKMLDPNGQEQDEDTIILIKQREEIDKEISKLVAQRKEFNDLIIKNCNHPLNKRALDSCYLTDTLGSNGWDRLTLICRDCGKTLKSGDDYHEMWNPKINYYEIKSEVLEKKFCILDIKNIKYEIKDYIALVLKNPYVIKLAKIKNKEKINNSTIRVTFEIE